MYIESLEVKNFRCFVQEKVQFEYAGRHQPSTAPRLPNVNLILGDNGTGKTALLRALTLAVLGPIIQSSGFRPYLLVRRAREQNPVTLSKRSVNASAQAKLRLHSQDGETPASWEKDTTGSLTGQAVISRLGDTETVSSAAQVNPGKWRPIFEDFSPAFFLAAYGASRRVAGSESYDLSARDRTRSPRYQRVSGLFEEAITLTPVNVWWNEAQKRERLSEGVTILNALLPQGVRAENESLRISGPLITSDVEFTVRGTTLPFAALSDGYRGFVGWVVDLLYQMGQVTPQGYKLVDLCGVVIVDELDLLLHPAWQRTVIETLATTFPRLQFFFTSHSPIVAGTLEAANIILTEVDEETGAVQIEKSRESLYGLSADQVLNSRYFGLASSRAPGAERRLRALSEQAIEDDAAAEEYLRLLADGEDGTAEATPQNGRQQPR